MSYLDDSVGEGRLRAFEIDNGPGGISWTFQGSHGETVEYETYDELKKHHPVIEEVRPVVTPETEIEVHAIIVGKRNEDGTIELQIEGDPDGFMPDGILWNTATQEWMDHDAYADHEELIEDIYDELGKRLTPHRDVV